MGTTRNRQIPNFNCALRYRWLLLLTLAVLSRPNCPLSAQVPAQSSRSSEATPASALPDEKSWHLLIEPQFLRPAVYFPIPGSQRTVFAPGYLKDGEPVYFTRAEYEKIHLSLDQFLTKSRANSSDKKVTARFIRTSNKTIEYAVLQSDSPLMATAVLAPDFIEKFKSLLGEKLIVAIPNRNTVFVFPAQSTDYHNYASQVLQAYRESAHPVSLEAFELSKDGLQAVGSYEE